MIRLMRLAALQLAGRRFWILPLLPLLWLAFQAVLLLFGTREGFEPEAAQNTLIGLPVAVLGVFLGVRIVAGEIDQRSLEIAYTVPGGAHRVWLTKLSAALAMLVASMALLAVVVYVFFTPFPVGVALYGALQAVLFYLVVSMGLATLFRSEVAGAMATAALLGLNGLISGFGENQVRVSPFWNPLALWDVDPGEVLARAVQNRIGFVLVVAAVVAMTFGRAERREKMLG
jgi:ABC-type transport system involved in multi-copper enzyme maturation permease subunit